MHNVLKWLESKVKVSPFPSVKDVEGGLYDSFEYRINVSDLYRPEVEEAFRVHTAIKGFWFPQGEAFGLSLESLYGSLRILWEAEQEDSRVLLHCHAGRNRSQMVYDSYYFMQTGKHPENSKLLLNIDDGQLPGIYRMETFFSSCLSTFEDADNLRPLDTAKHQMLLMDSGFL